MNVITPGEYQIIRDIVYKHCRISLGDNKQEMVAARLAKRMRSCGIEDIQSYCDFIESQAGADEIPSFIDAVSTNHTYFFRERDHFDFLENTILLQALASGEVTGQAPFKVWSAAASSGEEAYSIAMTLEEFFRTQGCLEWKIVGTDISGDALSKAKQAIFSQNKAQDIPQKLLKKYFQQGRNRWQGHIRAKEAIRNKCSFYNVNLLEPPYPFNDRFQLIFCRNVMIYFNKKTQEELIHYLSERLLPGGYLYIGHSESLGGIKHNLKSISPAIYRKSTVDQN